jgi:membrane-associated phospholipid phosphatase
MPDRWWTGWLIALAAAVLLSIAAARAETFPGDVAATKLVQSLSPGDAWAAALTMTARTPWNLALLAITAAAAWGLAGWRAALLVAVSYAVIALAGPWLQSAIGRPRPSPALVRVAGPTSGYSFPSIFALSYGSTIGFLLLLAWRRRQTALVLLFGLMLLVGGAARVALGAHWPSDMLVSYLIALVWAALLARFA